MKEELDKIYEIATRVLAEPPDGDIAPLVEICTIIEAVSQRKPAPWTPRERRLREALEEWKKFAWAMSTKRVTQYDKGWNNGIVACVDHFERITRAALADPPPPDPRDESLEKAEEALKPFASFGAYAKKHPRSGLDNDLYAWDCNDDANIRLTDLYRAEAALAAIAAVKREE